MNPPLVRMVAALPVTLSGYTADWSGYRSGVGRRPIFDMGEDFVAANGRRFLWMITIARWACIPFALLGGWICFLWARDLFGRAAGYVACALWCFAPMVVGHASVIAPDAHAAALGLAACYTFWRWLRRPTWTQAIVTGGVLGLAELAKTTMILFYPLWPVLWLLYRFPQRAEMTTQRWIREAGMLALRMLVGIYVLNIGYLAEGSLRPLGDYEFVSQLFGGDRADSAMSGNRFRGTVLETIPVPFPSNYVRGIDLQQRDFEDFGRPSYLGGTYAATGWWYYYAYAMAFKAPLGTLGLLLLTFLVRCTRLRTRLPCSDALVLLAPPIVIFIVASLKCGFSHHSRYILPCIPFVFIWVSQLAELLLYSVVAIRRWWSGRGRPGKKHTRADRRFKVIVGLGAASLIGWTTLSSLWVYPHSISYFNSLAGGPTGGPNYLLNSNVDWGQDLLFLESWNHEHAGDLPVYLAFYNYYNPMDLEIDAIEPWPFAKHQMLENPEIKPGFYAVSVNLLYDFPWHVRDEAGRPYRVDYRPMAYLRTIEPIGRAGYSIRVFSEKQMREAYQHPQAEPMWRGVEKDN